MIRIDRCVCFTRTFSDLREMADETGAGSIPDLQEHVEFGQNCGLCLPYVRRMLKTGETVFHEIITDDEAG